MVMENRVFNIKKNSYLFALFITSMGVILMSVESLFIKVTNISGITYSFYIGILMFFSLNSILLKNGFQKAINIYKNHTKIIIITGILTALANIFFINSIKHTTIANTVIIISSAPLFTTFFAYLIYKEKPQKNIFIASFFIFVGLFIIFSSELASGNLFGDILAIFCTISFSLFFVIISRHKNVSKFAILAFGGICLTIFSSFFIKSFYVDSFSLYILLVAGLLIGPVSRIFVLMGTRVLPASEVSLLTILETILAPIWAWVFLNEIPASNTIIGGIIILSTLIINSLYLMQISDDKK